MTVEKTIVCLANSKKHGGTCFAGVEVADSVPYRWIRPVSSRPGHEVSQVEQALPDGSHPSVLDVVTVGVLHAAPSGCQTENWLLDPAYPWVLAGRWPIAELSTVIDSPPTLWSNESSSTVGVHDRVSQGHLGRHRRSIGLILPNSCVVIVAANPYSGGRIDVRLRLVYKNVEYDLKITDPVYHSHYLALGEGQYRLKTRTLVTVSLAEPYTAPRAGAEAYSYKVVAAIIEQDGPPGGVV